MRWMQSVACAATIAALAACGDGVADSSSQPPDLQARDFSFKPAELTATAGEKTTFHVVNAGEAKHNLTIKDLDVDVDLETRGLTTITFTAESGVYEFVCKFHASQMTGELTVE